MLEYENGRVVHKGNYIHDPLKEFRRTGMNDVAYKDSFSQRRSIPKKKVVHVPVSTKPLEGYLVMTDPFKVIEDPEEKKRIEEEKRKAEEERRKKAEEEKKRIEEKKKGFEEMIMEIVDKMKGIEDSKWNKITGDTNKEDYVIRFDPRNEGDTAGMYKVYNNGKCMRIGTTKGGIMDGRELGFDDKGSLVYQTEYENGKKKRKWYINNKEITAVRTYDGESSQKYSQWWLLL